VDTTADRNAVNALIKLHLASFLVLSERRQLGCVLLPRAVMLQRHGCLRKQGATSFSFEFPPSQSFELAF
jgi:hypothetical protein